MTLVFTDSAKGVQGGHWWTRRGEGGLCDRSCCLCIYIYRRGKRICGVSGAYWGGPGHDFWLAINTQKYWVLSAAGYMGSYSSATSLPPPYFPPSAPLLLFRLKIAFDNRARIEGWKVVFSLRFTFDKAIDETLKLAKFAPIYSYIYTYIDCKFMRCMHK